MDSGTLLVQGATAEQLDKIRELIKLYDKPESLDADLQRQTEIYEVLYSRADAVAEVVKEVYRDLLSANDKTFTRGARTAKAALAEWDMAELCLTNSAVQGTIVDRRGREIEYAGRIRPPCI